MYSNSRARLLHWRGAGYLAAMERHCSGLSQMLRNGCIAVLSVAVVWTVTGPPAEAHQNTPSQTTPLQGMQTHLLKDATGFAITISAVRGTGGVVRGYLVDRGINSNTFTQTVSDATVDWNFAGASASAAVELFRDRDVIPGNDYYYRVRWHDGVLGHQQSLYSAFGLTVPRAPAPPD